MAFPSLTYDEYGASGLDDFDFYSIHNGFTAIIEAGWVKDKKDKGGETLFGVSRVSHPTWPVWEQVDAIASTKPRGSRSFIKTVESNKAFFLSAAKVFYADYYMPVRADEMQQEVGSVMYDLAVHAGIKRSVTIAQRAVNKLFDGKILLDDGKLGRLTCGELINLHGSKAKDFAKEFLRLRLAWHIKANPEYAEGFTRRVHNLWRFIFGNEM